MKSAMHIAHALGFASLLLHGCIAQVEDLDPEDLEEVELGGHSDELMIYGKEISLDFCDHTKIPADAQCYADLWHHTKCTYDAHGKPNNGENGMFFVAPKDEAATTLKWEGASFYGFTHTNGAVLEASTACNPKGHTWMFAKVNGKGKAFMTFPAFYDYPLEGTVRGTVMYTDNTNTVPEWQEKNQEGNLELVIQKRVGSEWKDLAKKLSPKPLLTPHGSDLPPRVLEVSARVEPNSTIRLVLRAGRVYETYEGYFINGVRLFSPVCVPNAAGTECL